MRAGTQKAIKCRILVAPLEKNPALGDAKNMAKVGQTLPVTRNVS